jgi:hypothetical protein
MHNVTCSLFLSLGGAAGQLEDFVSDLDGAPEANLRGVRR